MRLIRTAFPLVSICVAALLIDRPATAATECAELYDHTKPCIFSGGTYRAEVPETPAPGNGYPSVLLLHDAGQSAKQIMENRDLVDAFLKQGYAVIAPDALRRRNLRYSAGGSIGSINRGLISRNSAAYLGVSKKRFLVRNSAGKIRPIRWGEDSGWYYYNTDRVWFAGRNYSQLDPGVRTRRLGRDEIRFLRKVLAKASDKYGVNPVPELIIGIGHGGSLVWQIACYAPDLGRVLAPINGAFWNKLPKRCSSGANLVHTNHRHDKFWPLKGSAGNERKFARIRIARNIDLILASDVCTNIPEIKRNPIPTYTLTTWKDCREQTVVELMVMDEAFAFQQWWIDAMMERIAQNRPEPLEAATEAPVSLRELNTLPRVDGGFRKPGDRSPSRFKRP